MTRKIVIANEKGGVGKTTTAVNLAHGLALAQQRVLLLDLDVQFSATISLGLQEGPEMYDLFLERRPANQLVIAARDNLDIIRSDKSLHTIETFLFGRERNDGFEQAWNQLRKSLGHFIFNYDFVILDSGRGSSSITMNGLAFADELMVPISLDYLSELGSNHTIELVKTLRSRSIPGAFLRYIVPTFYRKQVKRIERILGKLTAEHRNLVTVAIRDNTAIAEAPEDGKTIFEHAPKSNGAQDYASLTKTVLHG